MFILIPVLLIFLYIGWFISSILGVLVSAIVMGLIYFGFTKLFHSMDIDPNEDSFSDGVRSYIGMIFAALIFLTTPIWDSDGFCAYQTEAYEVDKKRTLEDVFKGRSPTEMRIQDVSTDCKDRGAWDYLGGWDSDDNWRADVIPILLFLVGLLVIGIIWFFGAILKDIGTQPNVFSKTPNTVPEAIEEMQKYLSWLIENKDRARTEQINQTMPSLKECSLEQLHEIKSIYVEVLQQLPKFYKPKEIEKGMYDRKKATMEKKLASIEKQIERLG